MGPRPHASTYCLSQISEPLLPKLRQKASVQPKACSRHIERSCITRPATDSECAVEGGVSPG